jgi:hypothetical protein
MNVINVEKVLGILQPLQTHSGINLYKYNKYGNTLAGLYILLYRRKFIQKKSYMWNEYRKSFYWNSHLIGNQRNLLNVLHVEKLTFACPH